MKSAAVLQKLSDICRLRHLSYATEKSYAGWVRSYIQNLGEMPGEWTSEQKAGEFLTRIAKAGVAAATQNQALGHTKLETTMQYLTPSPAGVRSPLDVL